MLLIKFCPPSFYCDVCSSMVELVRTLDFNSGKEEGGVTLGLIVISVLFKKIVTKIISHV